MLFQSVDRRAVLLTVLWTVTAGCTSGDDEPEQTPSDDETETASPSPPERSSHEKIGSRLFGLVAAEDHEEYAERHGIELDDGRVKVTIELTSAAADVPEAATVTSRFEHKVDAWVHVDDVVDIAEHSRVQFVHLPREPSPQSTDFD